MEKYENPSLFNPKAAANNKDPILQVLKKYLPQRIQESSSCDGNLRCLEISSGGGQHIVYFANEFPAITFQPSEYEQSSFDIIIENISNAKATNIRAPIYINASDDFRLWAAEDFVSESSIDFIININMMQVSPYSCTEGLFKNSGQILHKNGLLFTYGPYAFDGKITPESNVRFDAALKLLNPEWGIRDFDSLVRLAENAGIQLVEIIALPANNYVVIWKKV